MFYKRWMVQNIMNSSNITFITAFRKFRPPFDALHEKSPAHYRKGAIGDWKNHMTEAENKNTAKLTKS